MVQKVRGAFGKWLQRTVTKSIDIIIWRARIIRTSARAAWLVAGAVAFRTVAAKVVAQCTRPEMSCGNGDNARPAAAAAPATTTTSRLLLLVHYVNYAARTYLAQHNKL